MRRPTILLTLFLALGAFCLPATVSTADAQGKRRKAKKTAKTTKPGKAKGKKDKLKVFDFTGLDVAGQLRTPQLLYFLDRANEELARASLERRSFIPEMVRSIDEEAL